MDPQDHEDPIGVSATSPAQRTPISEIMSRDVVSVTPDATLSELVRLFLAKSISGMPVVDADDCPLGVVSKTDVLRALGAGDREAQARDVMTPVTLAMPAHTSVARAAALMSYERVHRVIVVAPRGNVIGLVSSIDIVRFLAQRDGYAVP